MTLVGGSGCLTYTKKAPAKRRCLLGQTYTEMPEIRSIFFLIISVSSSVTPVT